MIDLSIAWLDISQDLDKTSANKIRIPIAYRIYDMIVYLTAAASNLSLVSCYSHDKYEGVQRTPGTISPSNLPIEDSLILDCDGSFNPNYDLTGARYIIKILQGNVLTAGCSLCKASNLLGQNVRSLGRD